MNTVSIKHREFILNASVECFNHCVGDFTSNKVAVPEKLCVEGCVYNRIRTF